MKMIFCGKIKMGEDSEFLIGESIIAEELDDWEGNEKEIYLKYTISKQPIDPEIVNEKVLDAIYGVLDADHGCIPFSEWTGFVAWDDTLAVGGHDLVAELLTYEDQYCYLEFWQKENNENK